MNQQSYSHGAWSIARRVDSDYLRIASVKPTLNASGRLEDGDHDRGKKASKLLDATAAFSSIVYGGTEEREASGNLCSCQQSL